MSVDSTVAGISKTELKLLTHNTLKSGWLSEMTECSRAHTCSRLAVRRVPPAGGSPVGGSLAAGSSPGGSPVEGIPVGDLHL